LYRYSVKLKPAAPAALALRPTTTGAPGAAPADEDEYPPGEDVLTREEVGLYKLNSVDP
jgi:hypothetical protein